MKRVFISLPMRGKSPEQIRAEQAELFARFVRETHLTDYEPIPTAFTQGQPRNDREAIGALANALTLLSGADAAYFARDYEAARGCRIEFTVAAEYHIPVYVEA